MKTKLLSVLLFVCISVSSFGQNDVLNFGDAEPPPLSDYLGFCLLPGFSGLVRFYEIHINSEGKFNYRQITQDDFVYKAKGKTRSAANPNNEDWFTTYGITDPNIVLELWRLRYKEYPYSTKGKPAVGWSSNDSIPDLPSKAQFDILEKYGIAKISDFCYGFNAFRLLHDMCNSSWVEKYKGASYGAVTSNSDGSSTSDANDEDSGFVD